jgi:hypothetical protein
VAPAGGTTGDDISQLLLRITSVLPQGWKHRIVPKYKRYLYVCCRLCLFPSAVQLVQLPQAGKSKDWGSDALPTMITSRRQKTTTVLSSKSSSLLGLPSMPWAWCHIHSEVMLLL